MVKCTQKKWNDRRGSLHRLSLTEGIQAGNLFMKWTGRIRITVWQVFLCCFWAGILVGTLVGNWETVKEKRAEKTLVSENREYRKEQADMEGVFPEIAPWRKQPGDREKFSFLCKRRLKEGGLGWLLGLTACAAACFCILAGYAGFLIGWTVVMYTMEWGIMGLPCFILSCFPQMLLYLPAWGILLWQGLEGKAKIRPVLAVTAALLLSGGAGLEAFVNPRFL